MFDRFKEIGFLSFTFSLIASYFSCIGYYSFFNVDVSPFLSIEDLTVIFAKYVWLGGVLFFVIVYGFISYIGKGKNDNGWWDKTIGKTILRRRAVVVLPTIFVLIILAFIYKEVASSLAAVTSIVFLVIFLCFIVLMAYSIFVTRKTFSEFKFQEFILIIFAWAIFVVAIPFMAGSIAGSKIKPDKVVATLSSGTVITSDSSHLIYIGKLTNYFFIHNKKTETTTAYYMENVSSLEVILQYSIVEFAGNKIKVK